MIMKDTIIIITVILGALGSFVTLAKLVYGQGKAKAREEESIKSLEIRDREIKSSIDILRDDIRNINTKMDKSVLVQVSFANEMQGRVSRIEGILNGCE